GWAEARYLEMQREIETILPPVGAPVMHRAADLRYLGQEHTVTVTVGDLAAWPALRGQFDEAHRRAYGYAAADVPAQLSNLRLAVTYPLERPRLPEEGAAPGAAPPFETRKIYSVVARDAVEHRVFPRAALRAGHRIEGLASVEEDGTTTLIDA